MISNKKNSTYKVKFTNMKMLVKMKNVFRKATGITDEKFNILLKFIDPGEDSCNIKMYDTTKRLSEETYTFTEDYIHKSGRTPRLDEREQFFLYLAWLKNGCEK